MNPRHRALSTSEENGDVGARSGVFRKPRGFAAHRVVRAAPLLCARPAGPKTPVVALKRTTAGA